MTPFCTTHGQGLVKPWSNPFERPLDPNVSRYFCRVLQISPKHFKFSQYKSCVFVERHNFHVEWHLKFGVEMCEK
jgi:hypothetical protein